MKFAPIQVQSLSSVIEATIWSKRRIASLMRYWGLKLDDCHLTVDSKTKSRRTSCMFGPASLEPLYRLLWRLPLPIPMARPRS